MSIPFAPRSLLVGIIVVASLASLSSAYTSEFEYCSKNAKYPVEVKAIEISPYPIARGLPANFSISATTGDAISKGKIEIDVEYFIFHVYQEIQDLCAETSCPVPAGDFVLSHIQTLPSYTLPGSYTLRMKILGEDGKQLTCITFGFSIGFVSPVADS